ncbi:MAG: sel1 repeat family protein, partial [Bacteroidales bacterium]|nr:sel1 repeat family protein [Bacteroidales bacterium]
GNNLKDFAISAFAGSENLKYVVINTTKPPKNIYNTEYDDFDWISYDAVNFVVPIDAQSSYRKADFWCELNYTHVFSNQCKENDSNSVYSKDEVNNVIKYATDGDMYSQFELSLMYTHGNGVEKSFDKSIEWLKKSAEQGYLIAMYNLSHYCDEHGDYKSKTNLLKQIRRKKQKPTSDYWLDKQNFDIYLRATNDLGVAYYDGFGVRKSYKKAFELYCKSAKYGVKESISNKGVCYEWGYGIAKNPGKAFCCYRHATQKGYLPAMVKLANCYCTGTGVKKDKEKYLYWMQKALNEKSCDAQNDIAYEYLTGKFLEKDLSKAKKYFMLSIKNPDGGAENKSATIASARKGNKLDIKMLNLCGIDF